MKITVLVEDDGDGLPTGHPPRYAFARTYTPGCANPRFRAQTFRERAGQGIEEIATELAEVFGTSDEMGRR